MKIMVDYSVWLGVEVDTETGEILRVACSDDPTCNEPDQFFNEDHGDEGNNDPEYLPADHPAVVKAMQIVERLDTLPNTELNWRYRT